MLEADVLLELRERLLLARKRPASRADQCLQFGVDPTLINHIELASTLPNASPPDFVEMATKFEDRS
jgi:hypothetical protein